MRTMPGPRVTGTRSLLPVFLFSCASGAISLGYQVIWFRVYADRFGSTNLTFLLVLVSFIGGLGLGSLISRRLSARLSRIPLLRDPLSLVGAIETAIAVTALLTLVIDPSRIGVGNAFPYTRGSRGIYEPTAALRLATGLSAAAMLLPTVLMGTTFPILCHAFRNRGVFPSELYAWNTLGACLGVLAAEFVLLPHIGHIHVFYLFVVMNILLGTAFFILSRRRGAEYAAHFSTAVDASQPLPERARSSKEGKPKPPAKKAVPLLPAALLAVATLSGLISGGLEVDMFRSVRFSGAITDSAMSFTSFWAIMAIFAASLTVRAIGRPRPFLIRFALLGVLAAHAVTWLRWAGVRDWFNARYMAWMLDHAHRSASVAEMIYPLSASLSLLFAFTGVIVFPSYYFVSLLLPTACNMIQGRRGHLGLAYGLNTVAFCAGAVLFTWIFPGVSLFYAVKLLLVVIAAGAGLALALRPGRPVPRFAIPAALVAVCIGAFVVPRGFDQGFFPPYESPALYPVRAMKSNGVNTIFVVEHPDGDILYFDSHPMSGTRMSAQRYMRLMAHMPLVAQAEPRRALLICFGVGNTAQAIAAHEEIESVDIVDLNDKVFEIAGEFAKTNGMVHRDPRVRLIHDDGRSFLERTPQTYDLVTSEPPPPQEAGVYRLYSVEYYRAVLAHLTPHGMMTQWVPTNALSRATIDRIVSSFVSVFPHVMLFFGDSDQMILAGGREPFDPALVERRFGESPGARKDLAWIGVREPIELFARITRIDEDLRSDVTGGRVISDERNDFAQAVSDPFDPYALVLDPKAVLKFLEPERLACGKRLVEIFSEPALIATVVPGFPTKTSKP